MNDLLDWISRNLWPAFFIGVFLILMTHAVADFLIRLSRSITGHYPPVTVVNRYCDSSNPCSCCRESGCQDGCRCKEEEEDTEGGNGA